MNNRPADTVSRRNTTLGQFLPEPDPVTGEIDPGQLPNSLPGYLINLTAEFTQNGAVIESAEAGQMGGELYETLALWSPSEGWNQAANHPIAGEYRAIGLDLRGRIRKKRPGCKQMWKIHRLL